MSWLQPAAPGCSVHPPTGDTSCTRQGVHAGPTPDTKSFRQWPIASALITFPSEWHVHRRGEGMTSRRSFLTGAIGLGATAGLAADPASAAIADSRAATEVWVSPDGDDAGPGTRNRPFRTIPRAQQ